MTSGGTSADGKGITRRGLVGTGLVGTGTAAILGLSACTSTTQPGVRTVSSPTDRRGVGYVLRIDQEGPSLVGIGYLTRVQGLNVSELFTTPPPTSSSDPRASDPSRARFTFHAQSKIESIAKLEDEITSTGGGEVQIFYQENGGATFDDPASFARGTQITVMTGTFQNGLAITEPNHASVSLVGDLTQTSAAQFSLGGSKMQLGSSKLPWSMQAGGRGVRTDPATPRSRLFLTGTLGVIDAASR